MIPSSSDESGGLEVPDGKRSPGIGAARRRGSIPCLTAPSPTNSPGQRFPLERRRRQGRPELRPGHPYDNFQLYSSSLIYYRAMSLPCLLAMSFTDWRDSQRLQHPCQIIVRPRWEQKLRCSVLKSRTAVWRLHNAVRPTIILRLNVYISFSSFMALWKSALQGMDELLTGTCEHSLALKRAGVIGHRCKCAVNYRHHFPDLHVPVSFPHIAPSCQGPATG